MFSVSFGERDSAVAITFSFGTNEYWTNNCSEVSFGFLSLISLEREVVTNSDAFHHA